MKCDWDLILDILLKASSSETSDPIVFTNGPVYGGRNQPITYKDEEEFNKVFINILNIKDYELAVVRVLVNRAAVAIDRITSKGNKFIEKASILKAIYQGISSEIDIATKLKFNKYKVNYYLKQFDDNDFIKGARALVAEGHEYQRCVLTPKGIAAFNDLSILFDESSTSKNEYKIMNASERKQSPVEEEIQDIHKQQKILILTAIPHGLRLDKEIREIEEAIRRAAKRDLFEIHIRIAVRPQDIRRAIAEEQPNIVHFCGHGLENGNLQIEDEGGNNQLVTPEALASLFKLHADYVKCVLLNACNSEKTAEEISNHIDYVIGMNNPIQDRAAIEFAKGFYDGLSYPLLKNQDIFQRAFDEAMVAIKMENISQGKIPILKKRL